jgi:hypothetical protein
MGQVENIFKNLPKPLEWRSFYNNDLALIGDICEEIRTISLENQLNKSQTKAISDVKKQSTDAFAALVNNAASKSEHVDSKDNLPDKISLKDMSAKEITQDADQVIRKTIKNERKQNRDSKDLSINGKMLVMKRLGIPSERIARRLGISRKRVFDCKDAIAVIQKDLDKGLSIPECAKLHNLPEPLIWHIALEQI